MTLFILAAPGPAHADLKRDGDGCYIIATSKDLLEFNIRINHISGSPIQLSADARLTADIDLTQANGTPTVWEPIGNYNGGRYTGTFDGAGHTVKGYRINKADEMGFFGTVGGGGTVRGLTVSGDINIEDKGNPTYAGGVAGNCFGTIEGCVNAASLTSSAEDVVIGGIVGHCRGGTISNCVNSGVIANSSDNMDTGGIAGRNDKGGKISNCLNSGNVSNSGKGRTGGIAGYNYNGTITNNVHNGGDVSASGGSWNRAGGIAGCNLNGSTNGSSTITNNTHSGGDVSASGGGSDNRAGGIAGGNSGGTITNNAHNGGGVSASGGSNRNSAGGITGYNFGGTISNSCWLDSGDLKAVGNETTVRVDVVSLDAEAMKKVVTTVLPLRGDWRLRSRPDLLPGHGG